MIDLSEITTQDIGTLIVMIFMLWAYSKRPWRKGGGR